MFPTYYAPQSAPTFPTFNPMQQNIPDVQYVNGPEGVDALNLPPNKKGVLFHQSAKEFYFITTDANGNKIRTDYTYTEKVKDKKSEYITRGEFEAFKSSLERKENPRSKDKRSPQNKEGESA